MMDWDDSFEKLTVYRYGRVRDESDFDYERNLRKFSVTIKKEKHWVAMNQPPKHPSKRK